MSKVCILGDTHFGVRSDSEIHHNNNEKFYRDVFIPYLIENGITDVIQLGDMFDRRKYINFNTLKRAREYFFDLLRDNAINLYTLVGNHDIFFKNTLDVNSTSLLLNEYDNITIINTPAVIKVGDSQFDFIPWICSDNVEEVVEFLTESDRRICFGHFEFAGFEMDRGIKCTHGYDTKLVKKYKQVYSGHFHHKSVSGNVTYVGAPSQFTWADYGDLRGFHIFDTEKEEIKFVENPYSLFEKIEYDDSELYFDEISKTDYSNLTGKYVKVIVTHRSNEFLFESFYEQLQRYTPADIIVVEDFTDVSSTQIEDEIDQADDTMVIIEKVIDSMEIDLNKDKLKRILKTIYTEALAMDK